MHRNLSGKRFLITGATSGIGKALSQQLLNSGCSLALVGRNFAKLEALEAELPDGKAILVYGDVSQERDRLKIFKATLAGLGGLDGLINNAGIASWCHFQNSDESVLRQIMEVNFFAPVELIRLAIPHLTHGNQPIIVNVSSMTGRKAMPAWPEYSASKHALCGITEALRGEMARFDIETLLVIPGLTKTGLQKDMLRNEGKAKIDYSAGMEPAVVAKKILGALQSGKEEIVIGSDAKKMLRMNRFFPRLLDKLIARKVAKLYQNN